MSGSGSEPGFGKQARVEHGTEPRSRQTRRLHQLYQTHTNPITYTIPITNPNTITYTNPNPITFLAFFSLFPR